MIWPVKGLSLTLNLTSINKFIGTLIAQEVDRIEHPRYYLVDHFEMLRWIIPRLSAINLCLYFQLNSFAITY